jgi:hypothetical protein
MNDEPATTRDEGEAEGGPALEWRAWPLAQYPGRTAAALAVVAAAGVATAWVAQNVAFGVVGALILLFSLQAHFLPRRYRLDGAGVTVDAAGWKRTRSWDYFHSYYGDRLGIMLSTFTYPSRLDSFRGLNLRYGPANRDEVRAFVAARLPRAEKETRRRGRRGERRED